MDKFYFKYKTEVGEITVIYNDEGITNVILPYDSIEINQEFILKENMEIIAFLRGFFSGDEVEIPRLNIKITEFQNRVFNILKDTERGSLITYGELAKILDCSSPRAIGQALKRNPVPIFIPCHRVVGKGWSGGFAGDTEGIKMEFKRFLMKVEGIKGW